MSKDARRGYCPIGEWKWKSYDGKSNISLDEFLTECLITKDMLFFVGTDSQNYSKKRLCVFTTVLIAYKMGKGGRIVVSRDKVAYIESLR